jgi:hypothetical protein
MNAMISAETIDGFVRGVKILAGGQVKPPGIACLFWDVVIVTSDFYSSELVGKGFCYFPKSGLKLQFVSVPGDG